MDQMIDAHHHLWHYDRKEFGWMDDSMEILMRDYLPEELIPVSQNAGVSGTVVVQARQTVEETEWLLSVAETHPLIKGVVGWLDLRGDTLEQQLEELALRRKLVGLRHLLQDEQEKGFMLQSSFLQGLSRLSPYDLAYDLLILHHQLEEALQLVALFPGQRFVLDHMAKPPVRSGKLQPWKEQLEQLAGFPNVWCKVSGLVTEADHRHWTYEMVAPYLEVVSQAFGPGRILVGSDWPVCRLAAEYDEVMAIPRRFFKDWSTGDQHKIFFQNAIDCYELET